LKGWSSVREDVFENGEYSSLMAVACDILTNKYVLDDNEIKNYIRAVYNNDPVNFDIYTIEREENLNIYKEWKKKSGTKLLYLQQVIDGIAFIENFCIQNNLDLKQYRDKYCMKHVREEKYDYSIPIYMKLIDIAKLNTVEKMLLKKFIKKYDIIINRIDSNKELSEVLSQRTKMLIEVLQVNKTKTSKENKV
jgi:hypothetical protein